ncbi:hypothetical protein G5V57_21385 [Nordella sp. HKS 07]|uniref:hypothetical protein n=1 Tax=Nordella sp. HKS 07 TaxID=2712222 RepID=UPI0013E1DC7A|nr:hypothetical protein [Nordella sp. HKS 07]QIG50048.1 hypothetical protein G5V57_21385 [Nordella sp. HKS 07]
MKLSLLGIFAAGAAAILLQTGVIAQSSKAVAAEGCIVTDVTLHVKRCPAGVTFASGAAAAKPTVTPTAAEPEVTPTASAPAGCIKTDVMLHVKRCPA